MQPKISIIVPVYNVESVLERCLDSLIGQTLHQIEIICVDDGSTDRSPEILARYAEREPRMRCMRQTNQRQGAARNRGFEVATGEYVLYIDSDDWIDPAYCETLYEAAQRHDADIACCSFLKHRRQGTRRVAWYEEERCYEQLTERFAVSIAQYVIMPNHIHLMLAITDDTHMRAIRESPLQSRSEISKIVGYLKMNASKEIRRQFGEESVWQRGFHDHIIRDREDHGKHLRYIAENPMHWRTDELYVEA